MPVDDLPTIDPNVDYTQILPIQQKRTVAFINHFIMSTVSFLNKFAQSCESRLMEFEFKIQKVESALMILESQLNSISDLNGKEQKHLASEIVVQPTNEEVAGNDTNNGNEETVSEVRINGPRAIEDERFIKFFKMVQVGVPPPAVKIKMKNEGIDPNILDTPNLIIPRYIISNSNTNNESNSD